MTHSPERLKMALQRVQELVSDPRNHRNVAAVDGDMIRYRCGCLNEVHEPSGVLRSLIKCAKHKGRQRDPATLDRAYYTELGAVMDHVPPYPVHQKEIEEALGPFPPASSGRTGALEIGCGVSMYVPAIRKAGYNYIGLEPSRWAAEWMVRRYLASVIHRAFEDADQLLEVCGPFALILAAHVFEHLTDAPGGIVKAANLLQPGGELWVIVPNDDDPLNPDHIWTFNERTLRSCLESAGLVVERLVTRKYVKHEHFLYARARKP